jgi:hypothetical protein
VKPHPSFGTCPGSTAALKRDQGERSTNPPGARLRTWWGVLKGYPNPNLTLTPLRTWWGVLKGYPNPNPNLTLTPLRTWWGVLNSASCREPGRPPSAAFMAGDRDMRRSQTMSSSTPLNSTCSQGACRTPEIDVEETLT